ncbi:MAG TPA: hypothetical protein VI541_02040 [Actinomycetota bacterium]|nr:hypothetical protein [Actinomycetota bacterium]
MRLARIITSVALLAAGMSMFASPAQAAIDTTINFRFADPGSTDGTPRAGQQISGAWTVVVEAAAQSSLRSLSVALFADPNEKPVPAPSGTSSESETYPAGDRNSSSISLFWDTAAMTRYNGVYRLVAHADSQLGEEVSTTVEKIYVVNAASAPTGLNAALNSTSVALNWVDNPEGDILQYEVRRSTDGKRYSEIGQSLSSSYTDPKPPKGVPLTYEVVAVRYSPLDPAGVASAPSQKTSAITIPIPTETRRPAQDLAPVGPADAPTAPKVQAPIITKNYGSFSSILPYGAPPPQQFVKDGRESSTGRVLAEQRSAGSQPLHTERYIAGAFIMLIGALHLARAARRITAQ